jgi:hypothetical protein
MEDKLVRFLTESQIAARIKLPTMVVVQQTEMSPRDVMEVKRAGSYGPILQKDEICELYIGGQRIALGKIVKSKGEYYFMVSRFLAGENKKGAVI